MKRFLSGFAVLGLGREHGSVIERYSLKIFEAFLSFISNGYQKFHL